MITKIKDIKEIDDYKVIYFEYNQEERFTYLSKKSLEYWKNRGVYLWNLGDSLNVFELSDKKHFQIISVNGK